MPIVYTGLPTVLSRFPDHQETIKRLFREKETFQTLCEDYRKCLEALKYWNRCSSPDAPKRRAEYSDLLEELEAEILEYTNAV